MKISQYEIGRKYWIVSTDAESCLGVGNENYIGQLVEVVSVRDDYTSGGIMVWIKFLNPSPYILQAHGHSTPAYINLGLSPYIEDSEALRAWEAYDQECDE